MAVQRMTTSTWKTATQWASVTVKVTKDADDSALSGVARMPAAICGGLFHVLFLMLGPSTL